MNHKTEKRLVEYGCLAVLIGILVCFYLAYLLHWLYAIGVVFLIGIGCFHAKLVSKRDNRKHLEILRQAFVKSGLLLPEFQYSYEYEYPHFTLTFPSEEELKQAELEGCISAFKQEIQELYGYLDRKNNDFDIERAVRVTYKGWQIPPDAFDYGKPNDRP
jgi:hypothetical protein